MTKGVCCMVIVSAGRLLFCALVMSCLCGAQQNSLQQSADRWKFLNGSYWYVPAENIEAILSNPHIRPMPITDQTVFYIQTYAHGYFWGLTAVQLASGTAQPICFELVGSVTPEGAVNLSFTPTGSDGMRTQGVGSMQLHQGSWAMENQMSTGVIGEVTHWAYMTQCKGANTPCMQNPLPGSQLTLMQFLDSCQQSGAGLRPSESPNQSSGHQNQETANSK